MTKDEANLYLQEELETWEEYQEIESSISHQTRWSTFRTTVLKHKPTNTFWSLGWSRGSTEIQDNGLEDYNTTVVEVEPVEVTVIQYQPKKKS